jgi:dihydroneopterin aldolase
MDIVFIRGLQIDTIIGIHDWERGVRRPVILNLEMASDNRRAAASDRIEDAVDYETVARRLREFVSQSHFALVETLAERCADLVRNELDIPWVRLTLNKPGAVGDGIDVGVILERGTRDPGH